MSIGDSVSWSQTRSAPDGSATLNDKNEIHLTTTGRPLTNEEDALGVSARLIRKLNSEGAHWSDPVGGLADVDAVSIDSDDRSRRLQIQVVRASNNEEMWRKLSREGVAEVALDATKAADELVTAVRNKSKKYPSAQRRALILVIDAGRTPSHTFRQVHDLFRQSHLEECKSLGFAQVWAVGSVDELVVRLDV